MTAQYQALPKLLAIQTQNLEKPEVRGGNRHRETAVKRRSQQRGRCGSSPKGPHRRLLTD